jgi:two-component sensor histidine kinase
MKKTVLYIFCFLNALSVFAMGKPGSSVVFTRVDFIGGMLMLLALVAVAYDRYRIKRRCTHLLLLQKQDIDHKDLELQELNAAQNKLLDENEWLLKEIHHRVKNNLQIAMSLLNTQSFYLENEKALAAIRQSRNRMYAMSLIHQRLYQSDNLELIHMNRYIPELIDYIEESYAGDRKIHFRINIDPVKLDVAQAVPIGLIINEAVTNSIKHAFPGKTGGTIDIVLKSLGDDRMLLEIADDGVGLEADYDIHRTKTMGMELIDTLNRQIEGTMTVENRDGLFISIIFT